MKIKLLSFLLLLSLLFTSASYPKIESSTKNIIEHMRSCGLSHRVLHKSLYDNMHTFTNKQDETIRVMSFNMLFNSKDGTAPIDYTWDKRKGRIAECISHWDPDIIGSQELQVSQVNDLSQMVSNKFIVLGSDPLFLNNTHNSMHENNIIFINQEKFSVLDFKEIRFEIPSKNYFYLASLLDKSTGKSFQIINVHLTFKSAEAREVEAKFIAEFIQSNPNIPSILVGDFNTFPLRLEESFPFFDGKYIENLLLDSQALVDTRNLAILGHFGPLSTTNYNPKTKKNFTGLGSAGCFLDHIYVSKGSRCLFHTADPLLINGFYPSDHLPIVADIQLP